jgi:hypothetical protein
MDDVSRNQGDGGRSLSLPAAAGDAVFHWTLLGTNTGQGGTGNTVQISGYELWQFDNAGLIEKSKDHFDSAEYDRQLKHGVDQ